MYYSEKSVRFALWSNRMGNASTVSSNMRDAINEAREGVRDMGRAAGAAAGDLPKDLQMRREDFSLLAQQMADIVANRGTAAWQQARSGVDGVMSDAQDKSREAVDAMREISAKFVKAVNERFKNCPYTAPRL